MTDEKGKYFFPQSEYTDTPLGFEGITRRDWLAGLAMQTLITTYTRNVLDDVDSPEFDVFELDQTANIAESAYEVADAMIVEGRKNETKNDT